MDPRVKPAGDVPGSADKSSSLRKLDGVPGKVGQNLGRHGRAWPGHPRLSWSRPSKTWNARHKAGH